MLVVTTAGTVATTVSGVNTWCHQASVKLSGLSTTMKNTILIISNSKDIHVDYLIPILQRRQQQYFLLNLDHFPRDYQLNQMFLKGKQLAEIKHIPTNSKVNLAEVRSIWLRKPAEYSYLSEELSAQELAYAKLETEQAIFGLLYGLDCYWISHPVALRGSDWKGEQLSRAAKMGFNIPNSLLTNMPENLHSFAADMPGDMIFKSLSTPSLASEAVDDDNLLVVGMPTTLVTEDMLAGADSIRHLACQFQEYIPKAYELRVTIIGDKVFAAKIMSQQDERTKIDCRDMSAEIPYESTRLPVEIEQKCLQLVQSYGLNFSALDLIVTPEGEYVFLENNPNGQFLYIEQLIPEFQLFEALADCLIKGENHASHPHPA